MAIQKEELSLVSFRNAVSQRRQKGLSFIQAVYQTLDEFLKEEIKNSGLVLACRKGCSACCYQLVTCTEMEIDEIVKFIEEIPNRVHRSNLQQRLKKFAKKWQRYYQKNQPLLIRQPSKSIIDWQGKPCPFLNPRGGDMRYLSSPHH